MAFKLHFGAHVCHTEQHDNLRNRFLFCTKIYVEIRGKGTKWKRFDLFLENKIQNIAISSSAL